MAANELKVKTERNFSVDIVKAAAVFGVIVIHVSAAGFRSAVASPEWLSALFWGSITRASVPLFLMCSGALMLDPERELSVKRLYTHNMLRMVIALFVWGMVYKMPDLAKTGGLNITGIWDAVKRTLTFQNEQHLYYLEIALLVYAFLPMLRLFVRHADDKLTKYALILWAALGIVYPTVRTFWPFTLLKGIPVQWMMNMTYAAIGYALLGYRLLHYPPKRKSLCAVWAISGFSAVFFAVWYFSVQKGSLDTRFLEGMSVGVCLIAMGIFSLCCKIGENAKKSPVWLKTAVTYLSRASFCVYLVHMLIMRLLEKTGAGIMFAPCIISIPLISLLVLAGSLLCYELLRRIPVLKNWII